MGTACPRHCCFLPPPPHRSSVGPFPLTFSIRHRSPQPRVTLRRIRRPSTFMAELAAAEVYPTAAHKIKAVAQTWRGLVNWLGFLIEIVVQILRGTPSWAQILFSASTAFKPLGSEELPTNAPPPPPLTAAAPIEKLTVVLDLDETLVCAYETSSLPTVVRSQAVEAGIKCFELECTSTDKEVGGKSKTNHVTVFERPGLREFLRQINQFADLVLFTAGVEGYARPLVDRIDVEGRFSLRLYRPSTVSTGYREHVKDLSCLSKNLCRTVIVDNNPFSFVLQPLNGIPCVPFTAGQLYDEQLMGSLLPLLKHLSLQKDVRPVLYETFHMPEWFEKHGVPSRL